jgi:hypothetical protein
MAGLRTFANSDVDPVADLVWRVLHGQSGSAPSELKVYFDELFLRNPWRDDNIVSRVFENSEGRIVGFFGAVPRQMVLQGSPVRLAFGSNFVVDPSVRMSSAAIQLVRAFMRGGQDISITDSANEMSRQLLRSLGFNVIPVYSLLWARPLRPSTYAIHGMARLKKKSALASVGGLFKPLCGLLDSIATRVPSSPVRQVVPETQVEELDIETHLQCLKCIPSKHWLLPEYTTDTLAWTMNFVTKRKACGIVRQMLVRERGGEILGWFIYYVAPGNVGEVLQIGAHSRSVGPVLDHLFYDAWKHGLIGLHGRLEPQMMEELTMRSCIFLRNGSWTLAHSNRPDLINCLQGGISFFSRLDGEWSFRDGIRHFKASSI